MKEAVILLALICFIFVVGCVSISDDKGAYEYSKDPMILDFYDAVKTKNYS